MTGQAPPHTLSQLGDIRAEIDAIDQGIFDLLVQRSALVQNVARAKADAVDTIPLRPLREASQMARILTWCRETGIAYPDISILTIWREIIGASIAQQGGMVILTTEQGLSVARLYFGSALTYKCLPSAAEVLSTAIATNSVGVVSIDDYADWQNKRPMTGRFVARLSLVGADRFLCFGELPDEQGYDASNLDITYLLEGQIDVDQALNEKSLIRLAQHGSVSLFSGPAPVDGLKTIGSFVSSDLRDMP